MRELFLSFSAFLCLYSLFLTQTVCNIEENNMSVYSISSTSISRKHMSRIQNLFTFSGRLFSKAAEIIIQFLKNVFPVRNVKALLSCHQRYKNNKNTCNFNQRPFEICRGARWKGFRITVLYLANVKDNGWSRSQSLSFYELQTRPEQKNITSTKFVTHIVCESSTDVSC